MSLKMWFLHSYFDFGFDIKGEQLNAQIASVSNIYEVSRKVNEYFIFGHLLMPSNFL